jgi:DNA (cytosine-5)-methyltransferase 1
MNKNHLKVVELFAGVGGFRVGFNNVTKVNEGGYACESGSWNFVWMNQWEPSTKVQHAFSVYVKRFGESENHVNEDIFKIDKSNIPNHEVLVGGFPCQDYSVARSLSGEKGIEGKKGVLWWEIYKTIKVKKPKYVLLENVDRLIKSPSKKRGRDFGIMLACFQEQNYSVEWRVINAADYGFPQKRRRVFIFAKRNDVSFPSFKESFDSISKKTGFFASEFSIVDEPLNIKTKELKPSDLIEVSDKFSFDFENYGYLYQNVIYTSKVKASFKGKFYTLKDVFDSQTDKAQFIVKNLDKWKYLKSGKKILRTSKTGYSYVFSEGPVPFPDNINSPSRTMLTSESTLNRSSHLLFDDDIKEYRTLTPIEAERLNGFPDNWTEGLSTRKRFFMMGNALVTGLVAKMGQKIINLEKLNKSGSIKK